MPSLTLAQQADVEAAQLQSPPLFTAESVAPVRSEFHWLIDCFSGHQGLRAGWSLLIFILIFFLFANCVGIVISRFHLGRSGDGLTAFTLLVGELNYFLPMLGAAVIVAWIERRRSILEFNLTGPRRAPHFFSGLAAGFLALSTLVGALTWGGWLRFGPVALSGAAIFKFGAVWGVGFLLVGCSEEGVFRCYLQSTLTRGINFWWALAVIVPVCAFLLLVGRGNGVWGVYAAALLGVFPCLILQIKNTPRSGFWQAAWVTSTLFGFIHIGNGGENWIGIFAAALIGFVFCVSIYVTGSAWWAIGCHAAWDWAETFFYGTADSGMVAPGHFLKTMPAGNVFWSGGADGPEGSILVLGVILLLLAALLVIYGRKQPGAVALERTLG
jgi:membrane protease YdiL (CAAX protease family)